MELLSLDIICTEILHGMAFKVLKSITPEPDAFTNNSPAMSQSDPISDFASGEHPVGL